MNRACIGCAKAKRRCDGSRPCARCLKMRIPCEELPDLRRREHQEETLKRQARAVRRLRGDFNLSKSAQEKNSRSSTGLKPEQHEEVYSMQAQIAQQPVDGRQWLARKPAEIAETATGRVASSTGPADMLSSQPSVPSNLHGFPFGGSRSFGASGGDAYCEGQFSRGDRIRTPGPYESQNPRGLGGLQPHMLSQADAVPRFPTPGAPVAGGGRCGGGFSSPDMQYRKLPAGQLAQQGRIGVETGYGPAYGTAGVHAMGFRGQTAHKAVAEPPEVASGVPDQTFSQRPDEGAQQHQDIQADAVLALQSLKGSSKNPMGASQGSPPVSGLSQLSRFANLGHATTHDDFRGMASHPGLAASYRLGASGGQFGFGGPPAMPGAIGGSGFLGRAWQQPGTVHQLYGTEQDISFQSRSAAGAPVPQGLPAFTLAVGNQAQVVDGCHPNAQPAQPATAQALPADGIIGAKRSREAASRHSPADPKRAELARLQSTIRELPTDQETIAKARAALIEAMRTDSMQCVENFVKNLVSAFARAGEHLSGRGVAGVVLPVSLQSAFARAMCSAIRAICGTCSQISNNPDAWLDVAGVVPPCKEEKEGSSGADTGGSRARESLRKKCSAIGQESIQTVLGACPIPAISYQFPIEGNGVNPADLDVSAAGGAAALGAAAAASGMGRQGQSAGGSAGRAMALSSSSSSSFSTSAQAVRAEPEGAGVPPGLAARSEFFASYQVSVSPAMEHIAGVRVGGAGQATIARGGMQYLIEGGPSHLPYHTATVFAACMGRKFIVQRSYPFVGLVAEPGMGGQRSSRVLSPEEYVEAMEAVSSWLQDCKSSADPEAAYRGGLPFVMLRSGKKVSARTTAVDLVTVCLPKWDEEPACLSAEQAATLLSRTEPVEPNPVHTDRPADELTHDDVLFPGRRRQAGNDGTPPSDSPRGNTSRWGGALGGTSVSTATATAVGRLSVSKPPKVGPVGSTAGRGAESGRVRESSSNSAGSQDSGIDLDPERGSIADADVGRDSLGAHSIEDDTDGQMHSAGAGAGLSLESAGGDLVAVLSSGGFLTCVLPAGAAQADIFARVEQLKDEIGADAAVFNGNGASADHDRWNERIARVFVEATCKPSARDDARDMGTWVGGTVRLGRRCDPIIADHRKMPGCYPKLAQWMSKRGSQLMRRQQKGFVDQLGPFAGGRFGHRLTPQLARQRGAGSESKSKHHSQPVEMLCDPIDTPLLVQSLRRVDDEMHAWVVGSKIVARVVMDLADGSATTQRATVTARSSGTLGTRASYACEPVHKKHRSASDELKSGKKPPAGVAFGSGAERAGVRPQHASA